MEGIDKIGFELGWDHASHGVQVPPDCNTDTVKDGYNAGLLQMGRSKPKEAPTRYVRKWLQLRRNAWKRKRCFDESITHKYLDVIDVVYCPITRERLTHSTGTDTDWSVDRLNNDGGYVPGNLVVMSVRANKAKDQLSLDDVYAAISSGALGDVAPLATLTQEQTARLYTMVGVLSDKFFMRCRVFPPPLTPCNALYTLQAYITALALVGTVDKNVKVALRQIDPNLAGLPSILRKITDAGRVHLLTYIRQNRASPEMCMLTWQSVMWATEDIWKQQDNLYDAFYEWARKLSAARYAFIERRIFQLALKEFKIMAELRGLAGFAGSVMEKELNGIRGSSTTPLSNGYLEEKYTGAVA